MENYVVDLVISMDEGSFVFRLGGRVTKESDHVVLMGNFADRLASLFVLGRCLCFRDGVEGCDLPVVEACGFAVRREVDSGRRDAVEFCKSCYRGVPPRAVSMEEWSDTRKRMDVHLCSLFGCYTRNRRILKDSAVEKLHDVEVTAYNTLILTKSVGFRDWDISLLKGMDNSIFSVHLMSCLEWVVSKFEDYMRMQSFYL